MESYRKTYIEIDLAALKNNTRSFRKLIASDTLICAVVKADAYGHGAVEAARAFLAGGADYLAVALAEEGETLRRAGISAPILVLTPLDEDGFSAAARNDLTVSLHHLDAVEWANRAAGREGKPLKVHLAADTGLSRDGFRDSDSWKTAVDRVTHAPNLSLTGAFTHFADADNDDAAFTDMQLCRFLEMKRALPKGVVCHAAATSASLRFPQAHFNMVRPGIALYGYPGGAADLGLTPAFSVYTVVTGLRNIAMGDAVSYGCTFVADRPRVIATLAVGYGDGVSRRLSNNGEVLISGVRCPIVGSVCMDQMMVDVTSVPRVNVGDGAVLMGRDGDELITAEDIAKWEKTICYEVLLNYSARVPRRYLPFDGGTEA